MSSNADIFALSDRQRIRRFAVEITHEEYEGPIMRISRLLATGILSLSFAAAVALPTPRPVDGPKFASPGTVTTFQLTDKTAVPGKVLKAGNYTITVVDHLTDRMVLRIASDAGKEETTFLALPGESRISKDAGTGPVLMNTNARGSGAMRGFVFPNGAAAEFVYSKEEAVPLAKVNGTTVPAIDPASEGRVAAPKLSKADLEVVTLWMLTPTQVGADRQPGIAAARYQPEAAQPSAPAVAVASAEPSPRSRSVPTVSAKSATSDQPVQEASVSVPPAPKSRPMTRPMAALPHTASAMPLMFALGGFSLLIALLLGIRRVTGTTVL